MRAPKPAPAAAVVALVFAFATLLAGPAAASFHEMQIEQVIGGVDGATTIQAIQLRTRALGQNLVANARLVVRDASGANPVLLIAFPSNVTNSASGVRVLAATSAFAAATTPPLTPDFILTNPIPASYLAAGSLTYEDNFGGILWRVSWGGAAYTGPGTGGLTNDADGNFNPQLTVPLPSTTEKAMLFQFTSTALSLNNAHDYALTAGAATFTNNAGASGTLKKVVAVGDAGGGGQLVLSRPTPNPVRTSMTYGIMLPREARVRLALADVTGRVVRTLADRDMSAGSHVFNWDAGGGGPMLASGVYFLQLDAGGARKSQRFVLVR